jgi:hypothetical protein
MNGSTRRLAIDFISAFEYVVHVMASVLVAIELEPEFDPTAIQQEPFQVISVDPAPANGSLATELHV